MSNEKLTQFGIGARTILTDFSVGIWTLLSDWLKDVYRKGVSAWKHGDIDEVSDEFTPVLLFLWITISSILFIGWVENPGNIFVDILFWLLMSALMGILIAFLLLVTLTVVLVVSKAAVTFVRFACKRGQEYQKQGQEIRNNKKS